MLPAVGLAIPAAAGASPRPTAPANLALKARVSATSQYSPQYAAGRAVDGKVTDPAARSDTGTAWAVNGQTHRDGADFTLRWDQPVAVAEIVYYGRTASQWNENWKDYAVHADGAAKPVATGRLRPGRGPQRIPLPKPVRARQLTLTFLSSYGGMNPGAVEIQVYAVRPPASLLGRFLARSPGDAANEPLPQPPARKPGALLRKALAGPLAGAEEIVFAVRAPGRDGHWYANFGYYARSVARKAYGPGGGGLYRLNLRTGKLTRLLHDPDGAVRDPQVHYDGRKILFACRKGGTDYYHLYEIRADGSGLRQLTDGPWDDIEPTYLPDRQAGGGIMFCSSRCKRWVNCWLTQVAVLYRCDADGRNLRPVSSNAEHDNTPWPLPDGRVLYTRWEYIDRSQVQFHHLWVMNPDGTGQMVYFGNMHAGTVMIDAKPIPGTDRVVAVFSPGHGRREHAGPIYVVDPRMGPDDRPSARRISGGSFKDPYALSEECFLVASQRQILLMDAAGATEPVYTLPASHRRLAVHEPRPLRPRPREPVIAPKVDPTRATGRLVLADVTIGRNMPGVRRGQIRKLLVLESLPKPINYTGGMEPLSYGGTFTLPRILGTVPVEADGSAYLEVPALRSLFFVALDERGLSVKRMQSFLTVQPGEVFGCVGCHEQRQRVTPPGRDLRAMRRPPSRIRPVPDAPDVVDFPRDVQPVLDRHCLKCHDYDRRRGGVILSGDRGPMFSHSYYTLTVRDQVADGRNAQGNRPPRAIGTAASPLMRKIDPAAFGARDHHGVKASRRERQVVWAWIESGAPYPGTYAALGTGMIGGYDENRIDRSDTRWPSTKSAMAAIARRCSRCHARAGRRLPTSPSDNVGGPPWVGLGRNDPRRRFSRHLLYNLTRPDRSLLLLAPLARQAGGYGMARRDPKTGKAGEVVEVFRDTSDGDYRKILAAVTDAARKLDEIKRFDMPGFRPSVQYLREMKRYGLLPKTFDAARDPIDPYALDRAYWRSAWYTPPGR